MKVYSPTGQMYEGEPVDCRELKELGRYTDEMPTEEQIAAELAKQEEDSDVTVRGKKPAAKKPK